MPTDLVISARWGEPAQFGQLPGIETGQHRHCGRYRPVQLRQRGPDALVDLLAMIIDVLPDRDVNDVLLRIPKKMRGTRDQLISCRIDLDRRRSHYRTPSPSGN